MEDKKLVIGFVSHTRQKMINNFNSFKEINKDIISSEHETEILLNDGTIIKCIAKGNNFSNEIDQLLISDDAKHRDLENYLLKYDFTFSELIPNQFKIIYDDIEEN